MLFSCLRGTDVALLVVVVVVIAVVLAVFGCMFVCANVSQSEMQLLCKS